MTTILVLNTAAFALLTLCWSSRGWNTLIKFILGTLAVVNGVQFLMALGYIVRS